MSDHRSPRPSDPRPAPAPRRHRSLLAVLALGALVVAACSGGPATTASPSVAASLDAPGSIAVPSGVPTAVPGEGGVPQAVIDLAIADAADRAGVDPAAVTVVSAEARTWPSGALGCPEKGYLYTDMITPGYRIVVEADGRQYDYRATQRGQSDVRWCERPPAGD
jgi:hypothetical protein